MFWTITMETIRITTDTSKHAGCGGLLSMSEEAPLYIVEHKGLETRIPGVYAFVAENGFAHRTRSNSRLPESARVQLRCLLLRDESQE
jgi:hypothetical protein